MSHWRFCLSFLEVSKQDKKSVEEARKHIYLVDSNGLITKSRFDSLQAFKQPFAHEHDLISDLVTTDKAIKPTVMIGTTGKGGQFTQAVLEEISSYQEKPVVFALSNPTSQSECTAEDAFKYTKVILEVPHV